MCVIWDVKIKITTAQYTPPSPHPPTNSRSLRRLTISNCALEHVPAAISHLIHLESLDFSRNRLRTLHDSLSQLSSLLNLRVDDNPLLRSIPANICNGLVRMMQTMLFKPPAHQKHTNPANAQASVYVCARTPALNICATVVVYTVPNIHKFSYQQTSLGKLSAQRCNLTCLPPNIGCMVELKSLSISAATSAAVAVTSASQSAQDTNCSNPVYERKQSFIWRVPLGIGLLKARKCRASDVLLLFHVFLRTNALARFMF